MSKPPKKVKPDFRDTQPPSRKWLVFQNRRQLWESMTHLHGTSIDNLDENGNLSEFDKDLIRQFGGYKNDKTKGQFRSSRGGVIEPVQEGEDEYTEVKLFND